MPEILIGTSGYDYPEWRGVFYPAGLKRADFLPYYATQFNALELNSSFYNMPTAERLLSFWERSGGALKFSVKANRLLTHEIGRDWKSAAQEFLAALKPLAQNESLASALFQFPQSFHYTDQNRMYLSALLAQFRGLPAVVEFRHAEWIRPSVFEGLSERGASLAFCDMPELKNLPNKNFLQAQEGGLPFAGKIAYIRLHGRNASAWYAKENDAQEKERLQDHNALPGLPASPKSAAHDRNGSARYRYDYSDEELSEFAPVIQQAASQGRQVQVFFNNHPDGSGAKNARRMREMLLSKD
ncbi:MAG: DUF72 domain-containing protein [Treponema sp.]|nr:DUF72 domain-containing protein [Treponema sp.]